MSTFTAFCQRYINIGKIPTIPGENWSGMFLLIYISSQVDFGVHRNIEYQKYLFKELPTDT